MNPAQARLPTKEEIVSAKAYSRELARFADEERVHVKLSTPDKSSDDLVLPGPLVELMLRVATEVSMGNGVSILPIHAELTTQQAANLLNVSRPYLVRLLEEGDIPFHKVGSHRRVYAQHVLEFQTQTRAAHEANLDALIELSDEMGLYEDDQPAIRPSSE